MLTPDGFCPIKAHSSETVNRLPNSSKKSSIRDIDTLAYSLKSSYTESSIIASLTAAGSNGKTGVAFSGSLSVSVPILAKSDLLEPSHK